MRNRCVNFDCRISIPLGEFHVPSSSSFLSRLNELILLYSGSQITILLNNKNAKSIFDDLN